MHKDHSQTSSYHWLQTQQVEAQAFVCGYCSSSVGSDHGLQTEHGGATIRICPNCNGPSFFNINKRQWPGPKEGASVSHLSDGVQGLYEESRASIAANAFTGAVMLCRKILMHVAVEKGAPENQSFQTYVQWLVDERYAPKGAEVWLNYIRNRGNEANHEIVLMNKEDAMGVLRFTEAMLRAVYELPALVPSSPSDSDGDEPTDE